ncbi:MAG: sigma-70 family RNA polymerase sigma factor [Sphingobium sp.]
MQNSFLTILGWERLRRRVRRFAGHDSHAEDLLQEALARLEVASATQEIANREAFVMRAARNIAVDESRKAAVRRGTGIDVLSLSHLADDCPLPDEVMIARERLALVTEAITHMPERTRNIFLMHRLDEMTYREIAAAIGISVSAVEKHIARAVMTLMTLRDEP